MGGSFQALTRCHMESSMNDEKSDSASPSLSPVPNFVGPSSLRSRFDALPTLGKLSALAYFCARTHGQVADIPPSSLKSEEVKQSVGTCMLCLTALARRLSDCGVPGIDSMDEPEY